MHKTAAAAPIIKMASVWQQQLTWAQRFSASRVLSCVLHQNPSDGLVREVSSPHFRDENKNLNRLSDFPKIIRKHGFKIRAPAPSALCITSKMEKNEWRSAAGTAQAGAVHVFPRKQNLNWDKNGSTQKEKVRRCMGIRKYSKKICYSKNVYHRGVESKKAE